MTKLRVGEALIRLLEQRGVEVVFGIPGVHTIELYRGLGASAIRHVTPRHEQGAAFMADGYARVTGKPGVCLLITGPGFTNALTAIGQARGDSIPMFIISGVNARSTLGKGEGRLHELPDQAGLSRTVCLETHTLLEPERLGDVVARAFDVMASGRPGPVHIEIPTDVMAELIDFPEPPTSPEDHRHDPKSDEIDRAVTLCSSAKTPAIIAGGGMKDAVALKRLAEALDAPVVSTVNARGLMAGHPLNVPASPSLKAVRGLINESDLLLALGTEIGETDYDFFMDGGLPSQSNIIRVDIDPDQFKRRNDEGLMVEADAVAFAGALADRLTGRAGQGVERALHTRQAALDELPPDYRSHVDQLHAIWRAVPEAIIVGDSTQAVYAGNLYTDAPSPHSWFNSSTGFGTLGYAAPAAIGAALGHPDRPVICLIGDGGLQFTLAELGSAAECGASVTFLVWNNEGYREIENFMVDASFKPIGVKPSTPDFAKIAEAYGLPAVHLSDPARLVEAIVVTPRPGLIEYRCP
ncbi:MAG: 5-guanidino-2-oxopentanoate decarboxylase [Pseudomonadota bacterium]